MHKGETLSQGGIKLKALRGVLRYFISFVGAFAFCLFIIAFVSFLLGESIDEIMWGIWFIGSITLFYVFIGSLFWEFLTWRAEGVLFFLIGVIYGGIAIAIITFTIGETTVIGWIVGISMVGIAAFIFYVIRKIPQQYSIVRGRESQ